VTPPARPGRGTVRAAGEADADRLVPWAEAFLRDVDMPKGRDECAGMMAERIREQRLFVWCDPEPVSMAGWAGRTPNGVRVNFVYTPPECRGRGYASACVAALSQHLLDSGRKFCCLFTDLANPTSNKIYQAIGYRRVCDFRYVRFEPVSS
jgi:predicted GNAT family acetyltransferase